MDRATHKMRSIAAILIAFESPRNKSTATKSPAAFDVIEKLRPLLANLTGNGGFHALLSRALALARVEVAWLGAIHVNAGGILEWPGEPRSEVGPAQLLQGRVALLAELLSLLEAFIGKDMTSLLVGEIWPEFPPSKWNSAAADAEVQNEEGR
jgi:hypothetical protein